MSSLILKFDNLQKKKNPFKNKGYIWQKMFI